MFVDIDGTLTTDPENHFGPVVPERIDALRRMLAEGRLVVVWSGGGTAYAKSFCKRHGIVGAVCIGKPELMVDDNPHIRPQGRMPVLSPEEFFAFPWF